MGFASTHAEVVRLHDFLAGWFRGEIGRDRFGPDFADALHPEFENVQPAGRVLTRADLIDGVASEHASNPEFRISIETPRMLGAWPGLVLFGYVEWQTGARNSARENRRRSTVLFETSGERLIWRHLTEVGLQG